MDTTGMGMITSFLLVTIILYIESIYWEKKLDDEVSPEASPEASPEVSPEVSPRSWDSYTYHR